MAWERGYHICRLTGGSGGGGGWSLLLFVCLFFFCFFFVDEKNQNNKLDERRDIGDYFWGAGYSHRTDFRPFYDKISANPEHKEDFQHHFSHRMGNVNWVCLILWSIYTSVDISDFNIHITQNSTV